MSWDEHIMLIAHTVNQYGDRIQVTNTAEVLRFQPIVFKHHTVEEPVHSASSTVMQCRLHQCSVRQERQLRTAAAVLACC